MRDLVSIFFVVLGLMYLQPALATNLEDLEICPNPNAANNPNLLHDLPMIEGVEVGYTCKVPTIDTRPYSSEGYKASGDVKWTLVQQDNRKRIQIWAAHTEKLGTIFVGYPEGKSEYQYNFIEAHEVCRKIEIIALDGKDVAL